MPEPTPVTTIESKLEMLNKSIQGHESVLRCNFTHIDNEAIKEKINSLWERHYYTQKALQFELLLNR